MIELLILLAILFVAVWSSHSIRCRSALPKRTIQPRPETRRPSAAPHAQASPKATLPPIISTISGIAWVAARFPLSRPSPVQRDVKPVYASTPSALPLRLPSLVGPTPSLVHVRLPESLPFTRENGQSHSRKPSSFYHFSTPEVPFLDRHCPTSSVLRASPPPCRPRLALTGYRLTRATSPTELPVLLLSSSSMRATANTPADSDRCTCEHVLWLVRYVHCLRGWYIHDHDQLLTTGYDTCNIR